MEAQALPGSIVAFWHDGKLAFAAVLGEEKQRIRLLLAEGHEERVTRSRILFDLERGAAPGANPKERAEAARRAAAAAARAAELSSSFEVADLWSIAREAGKEHEIGALAELALGEDTGLARAAAVLALLRDGIRFVRKGECWEARSTEVVLGILEQEERVARREREQREALLFFRAVVSGEGVSGSGSEAEQRYLAALQDLAVHDLATPEPARALAQSVLAAVTLPGDRPSEKAFRLLRKLGRFHSDDENLVILRHRLRTEFPAKVLEAARDAAAREIERAGRADLTDLTLVTIDNTHTREIDDGLSFERRSGGSRIGIHIADPGALVDPGGEVDLEALARSSSHYFPDLRLPMLPPQISEERASLVCGMERPTLSFFVDLDLRGEIRGFELVRGLVRSQARLDYEDADRTLESGRGPNATLLLGLRDALRLHEARRVDAGALILEVPEAEAHVAPGGRVVLERSDPLSASRRLVAEAMVLAGAVAARFASERGIPILYRRQPAPGALPERPAGAVRDPVLVRALRRSLRRGEISLQAAPHFALALPAYAQVTSPLRRYQDLVSHRQILAALQDLAPPHGVEEAQRIAALTEEAEADARQAERSADLYWKLRYLEQQGARSVDGIVVDLRPVVVQLDETLLEERVPSLSGATLGERVTLRIERVNPRAELLVLRPA